jgi:Protein of unknown function (DUF1364)
MAETRMKPKNYRDANLLAMARGRRCIAMFTQFCKGDDGETTVAAHSNQLRHGKGRSLRASDCYSIWACWACHSWLDQGSGGRQERVDAFDAAHEIQIREWEKIAADTSETEKNRKSAAMALEQLKEHV